MLDARWLILPFALQVLCMGADELYYHRQRTLPRWERWGHPLDTLTVLLCMGWVLLIPPSSVTVPIFILLSALSSLFITKDEAIHHQECAAGEHWLHAVLFVLHPIILLSAGLLWPALHQQAMPWIRYQGFESAFLWSSTGLILLFGLYQLVYWNFLWKPPSANK